MTTCSPLKKSVRLSKGWGPLETKAPKLDEKGAALFNVPVFAAGGGISDSIVVKVAGELKGLSEFTLVKITNLVATTWEVGSNHGVSFRADRIELMKTSV